MDEYEQMKRGFINGWHTWNTRSLLSHVLMPEGFAINLCIKDDSVAKYMKEVDVGYPEGGEDAVVFPGANAYDGSYTHLKLSWYKTTIEVESATEGDDIVLLVRRISVPEYHIPTLVLEGGILWNKSGYVTRHGDTLHAELPGRGAKVFSTGEIVEAPYAITQTPFLAVRLDETVGFSSGKIRTVDEIEEIISRKRDNHIAEINRYGPLSEAYSAMQSCMAWDTVYDPLKDRIISPVSRRWNKNLSGYGIFCWDNYFAACIASHGSKEVAYSNLIEITREKTDSGFVPNYAVAFGATSKDRSQPPIGSMALREVYRKYREKWLIELLFDDLIIWNDWYFTHRQIRPGLFAWGSSEPYEPAVGHEYEVCYVNTHQAAAFESGLDNSPMFDDVPFNTELHMLEQIDVGLTGLYIMDCSILAELADEIGEPRQSEKLRDRAAFCEEALQSLWHEEDGIYYNLRTDNGEWSKRVSPTCFYPMLCDNVTPEQCERMVNEHFYNPDVFWGEYILPSSSRSDAAFHDQEYWRGRIWAPMNYLTYLGLRKHGLSKAAKDLSDLSIKLIMKEWLEKGHVHENYNAITGEGCDKQSSEAFYHWGGLLSLIGLIEAGYIEDPTKPLTLLYP